MSYVFNSRLFVWCKHYFAHILGYELCPSLKTLLWLKCRTALKVLFLYFNLYPSVILNNLLCSFTSISCLTTSCSFTLIWIVTFVHLHSYPFLRNVRIKNNCYTLQIADILVIDYNCLLFSWFDSNYSEIKFKWK